MEGDRGVWNFRLPYLLLPLPAPSIGVPASLFYCYCEMLRNILIIFFSFSPSSRHFGNPASRPFSSRLPYPWTPPAPYSPWLLPLCPPPHLVLETLDPRAGGYRVVAANTAKTDSDGYSWQIWTLYKEQSPINASRIECSKRIKL